MSDCFEGSFSGQILVGRPSLAAQCLAGPEARPTEFFQVFGEPTATRGN